jgi:hypothetical protein
MFFALKLTDLAADEVLLGYPNAQSKVMQAQQMLDKSKGGVTYASRFVLRRHTAAAATFNERWRFSRSIEIGNHSISVAVPRGFEYPIR